MRSRLRTLRIGAREFRWTAQLCSFTHPGLDYHRCVRVRVWGGGKNGRVLRADLASVNQGPWAGVPDSSYPTPVPCAPSSTTASMTDGTLLPPAAS